MHSTLFIKSIKEKANQHYSHLIYVKSKVGENFFYPVKKGDDIDKHVEKYKEKGEDVLKIYDLSKSLEELVGSE